MELTKDENLGGAVIGEYFLNFGNQAHDFTFNHHFSCLKLILVVLARLKDSKSCAVRSMWLRSPQV